MIVDLAAQTVNRKNLPWLVLFVSLCLIISSYVYFQKKYMLSTEQVAFFQATDNLKTLFNDSTDTAIKVVYFWQPGCPCDAGVLPHFNVLANAYKQEAVFMLADLSQGINPIARPDFPLLPDNLIKQSINEIDHTPAVGVWDQNGQLIYYGAHNLGFVCNAETSIVQKVLESLLAGVSSENNQMVGDGCFCSK